MLGAVGLGRQRLRLDDRLGRLEEIIEPPNLREVDGEDVLSHELAEGPIHPDPLLMSRRMERNNAGVHVVEEGLKVGSARLIHGSGSPRRDDGARDSATLRFVAWNGETVR